MKSAAILVFSILLFSGCDKGYQVRFTNLYTEKIDTLVVGLSGAAFSNIEVQSTTNYVPAKQGTHGLRFVTHSGERFYGTFKVPSSGSGKYTIQIDGIKQINVYEGELQ